MVELFEAKYIYEIFKGDFSGVNGINLIIIESLRVYENHANVVYHYIHANFSTVYIIYSNKIL